MPVTLFMPTPPGEGADGPAGTRAGGPLVPRRGDRVHRRRTRRDPRATVARPVLLAGTWTWLIYGVIGGALSMVFAPGLAQLVAAAAGERRAAAAVPTPSAGVTTAMVIAAGLLGVTFGVALPALMIWLLAPADVRATAAYFSPPTWTDDRPIPVLTVGLWLAFAAGDAALPMRVPRVPAAGPPAARARRGRRAARHGGRHGRRGRRLRPVPPAAWWAARALLLVWLANTIVTTLRIDPVEMHRRARPPAGGDRPARRDGGIEPGVGHHRRRRLRPHRFGRPAVHPPLLRHPGRPPRPAARRAVP